MIDFWLRVLIFSLQNYGRKRSSFLRKSLDIGIVLYFPVTKYNFTELIKIVNESKINLSIIWEFSRFGFSVIRVSKK